MATTIGALAYKIQLDGRDFTSGMKLSRQELNLVKKSMEATESPLDKMHASMEILNRDNVKAHLGAKKHAAAVHKVKMEYANSVKPAEKAARATNKLATATKNATRQMAKAKPAVQKTSGAFGGLSKSIVSKFAIAGVAYMAWTKFTGTIRSGARMAIGFLKSMADNVNDLDDKLNTMAKVGVSSKAFETMAIAGQKAGLSIETIGMAVQRMTRRIAEAAGGKGESLGALLELGLDPKKLKEQGPFEALRSIAVAMSKVENQSDKLRLAFKLFDSEGAQFVNVIGQGTGALDDAANKAEQFGTVLTKVQQDAISKTAAKFVDLKTIGMGLFTQLTAVGAPAFEKVADKAIQLGLRLLDIINDHGPQLMDWANDIADTFIYVAGVIDMLITDFDRFLDSIERGGTVDLPNWLKMIILGLSPVVGGAALLANENAGKGKVVAPDTPELIESRRLKNIASDGDKEREQLKKNKASNEKLETEQAKLTKETNKIMQATLDYQKEEEQRRKDFQSQSLQVKLLGNI